MGKITKVWIDETSNECISCGACEAACPEVFEMPDKAKVKADAVKFFESKRAQIIEGKDGCPVNVIFMQEA